MGLARSSKSYDATNTVTFICDNDFIVRIRYVHPNDMPLIFKDAMIEDVTISGRFQVHKFSTNIGLALI